MPDIQLGNTSVVQYITDPDTGLKTKYKANGIQQSTTMISVPPDRNLFELLRDVVATWQAHSDRPPAWVEADDPETTSILAKHFNCAAGRPADWQLVTSGEPVLTPVADGIVLPQLIGGSDVPQG